MSGLSGDTSASVTGCELSVNSGAFGSAAVRVVNGDRLRLRATASSTAGRRHDNLCTVDIGGVTDQFRVTTASSPGGGSSGGGGGGGGGAFDAQLLLLLLALFLGRVMSAPGRELTSAADP